MIDTPGDFDTDCDDEELKSETIKSLVECAPGVDAFIIVLKVGRYTGREDEEVQKLLDTFGDGHVLKHTVILFTHGEQLEDKTINAFMEDCPQLQQLVGKCGGRCHVIDSTYWNKRQRGNKSNRVQVKNLLKTIDEMVNKNGCFTNDFLQKVEKDVREEMKNITEDRLLPEEQHEKAKKIVHANYLKKFAGITIWTILGALFGIGVALSSVLAILQQYVAVKTALTAAGVAAGAGAGAITTGVLGAGGFVGAVGGAVIGWGKPESLCDMIAETAVDTWENGLNVLKKAGEMWS